MNDQAYGALLAAVEMDVRAQSKESKALLITLLKSGAVPREAINRALGQFEGAYYKTLADAYGTVLGTTLGVQQIRELPVSGVKLSDALYAHGKQTSAEVLGIIKRHANAMHDARGLAMQIYDGYGHRAKEAINLNPRNQKLPKYLREALAEDPSLGPSLQRLIAQAQITQIRTPALRAAYQKALDDFEAGAGTRRLDKALDVAYQEKMRYNANRIAQTELHRAYSDQKAREYMAEESLEVVQVRMSGSHPKTDICDLHSKLDKYGLGPGCYPKPLAPKPSYHPHCRCKLVPRWDLSAKGAREQGNAERLFLEDIGEKEGMRIVGSQARYFDIVKRGAKLEEVLNRGKDPLYQFARVGDVVAAAVADAFPPVQAKHGTTLDECVRIAQSIITDQKKAWPVDNTGKDVVRFRHTANYDAELYRNTLLGKADYAGLDVDTANAVNDWLRESHAVSDALGLPRLRGVNVAAKGRTAASMGDGILALNPRYIRVNGDEQFVSEWTQARATAKNLDPIREARPYTADGYFATQREKLHSTLWHEFGHHIHQNFKVESLGEYYYPPLEHILEGIVKGKRKAKFPTEYSMENSKELFAECYAIFKLGRADLLPDFITDAITKIEKGLLP